MKALNMRTVAEECDIALGTLYHYFSNKEDLLIAAIASVWQDIFRLTVQEADPPPLLFSEYVERMFVNASERFRDYPDFFTAHSATVSVSERDRAKTAMDYCTEKIRDLLLSALHRDNAISDEAFLGNVSKESFAEFVLGNMILLLIRQKSCDTLIAIIKKILY